MSFKQSRPDAMIMASEDKSEAALPEGDCSSMEEAADGAEMGKKRKVGQTALGQSEDDRKAERRAANRRSAFQSRQRRKILIEDLQKTVATLSKDNTELRNSNNQLRAKLETAMLENQLLRKQHGATGADLTSASGMDGTGGIAGSQAAAVSITAVNPSSAPSSTAGANIGGNSSTVSGGLGGGGTQAPSPTACMAAVSSHQGSQCFGSAAQLATNSQLFKGLKNLGGPITTGAGAPGTGLDDSSATTASNTSDPLLAARLALAGNRGNLNTMGNTNLGNMGNLSSLSDFSQHQQQNQSMHSMAGAPAGSTAGLNLGTLTAVAAGGGGQLHQQLAMLLSGGRIGSADQAQQQLALLQAALVRPTAAPSDSIGQAMRALSQMQQASSTTGAAKP